jgi:hypothetical protein
VNRLTVRCLYSCELCRAVDVPCDVPARGDEDVRTWMDLAVRHIARHHFNRNPRCPAKALSELKIPMTGTDRVGGPSVQ